VRSGDEDGVSTDTVHVDTGSRLNVVQVNVAVLGYDIDHVVFWAHLYTIATVTVTLFVLDTVTPTTVVLSQWHY